MSEFEAKFMGEAVNHAYAVGKIGGHPVVEEPNGDVWHDDDYGGWTVPGDWIRRQLDQEKQKKVVESAEIPF